MPSSIPCFYMKITSTRQLPLQQHLKSRKRVNSKIHSSSSSQSLVNRIDKWFQHHSDSGYIVIVTVLSLFVTAIFGSLVYFAPRYQYHVNYYSTTRTSLNSNSERMAAAPKTDESEVKYDDPFVKRLNILLMSDIHDNIDYVKLAAATVKKDNFKYDAVWIPGDLINIKDKTRIRSDDNNDIKKEKTQELEKHDAIVFKLLTDIKNLFGMIPIVIPGNVCCCFYFSLHFYFLCFFYVTDSYIAIDFFFVRFVYVLNVCEYKMCTYDNIYVQHDPDFMFTPLDEAKAAKVNKNNKNVIELGKVAQNIHNRVIKIDENLYMAGFGGSVPAIQDNKVLWLGYPFDSQEAFNKEFQPFIENIVVKTIKDKKMKENNTTKSIILFTHNGPSTCSTTVDWRANQLGSQIFTGADGVRDALLNESIVEWEY